MVIGKSVNPFKKIKKHELPVLYKANKNAWMTTSLFQDYIKIFDLKMQQQGRNVLVFLDNASVHKNLSENLNNVKLIFFPPNCTSHIQPLDQGIIQAMKLNFRQKQFSYIFRKLDTCSDLTGPDILKSINILDAIFWIYNSWKEVKINTVEKCFMKSGFNFLKGEDELDIVDNFIEPPVSHDKFCQENFGYSYDELLDLENYLPIQEEIETIDWNLSANEILDLLKENEEAGGSDNEWRK